MTLPADPNARSVRDWLPDRAWMAPVAGLAAGGLLARLLFGELHQQARGLGVGELMLVSAVVLLALGLVFRRRGKLRRVAAVAVVPPPRAEPPPVPPTDLDRGVHAIRRSDRGFDPARFAGYAAMMFRDVEGARMARDAGRLRDRLTPEMYAELRAFCDGLRTAGRSVRFDEVDVRAETTEAWQDGDRDYVTAYVAGSMLSHTLEDATGRVAEGSRTTPTAVEAFLTFTRPAGLNFWMLSIIQGA
jgi:predicted lipid-binding transport protein (Tim44 family)